MDTNKFVTEQEKFWVGKFGDQYTDRNKTDQLLASNIFLLSKVLSSTKNISSVIEIGANIGLNLQAIKSLIPSCNFAAVEINDYACKILEKLESVEVFNESLLTFSSTKKYDFVLSKGVLIHINPDHLNKAYELMYSASNKYICLAEYYSFTPVDLNYRGYSKKLFKRDFAGEMLDKFKDLKLIDYGFIYHKDNYFAGEDMNWFLLEKN